LKELFLGGRAAAPLELIFSGNLLETRTSKLEALFSK